MPKLRLVKGGRMKKLITASAALGIMALGASAWAEYVTPQQNIVSMSYRPGGSLYTGTIAVGTAASHTTLYWGGTWCSGVAAPDEAAIDIAYRALSANEPVLLYYNVVGGRYCWDGGIESLRTY
jgi:hypothetical protein